MTCHHKIKVHADDVSSVIQALIQHPSTVTFCTDTYIINYNLYNELDRVLCELIYGEYFSTNQIAE